MVAARLSALLVLSSALLAALSGCGGSKVTPEDLDEDGYTPSTGDCFEGLGSPEGSNLTGADIHPGAEDIMGDGIDQDCSGGLEYDFDGDGHDSQDHGGADCDDDDPAISPDAEEICNGGVDDDCSGLADDEDPNVELGSWYLDFDDDGYGDEPATAAGCTPPEGYAIEGGDCDDADGDINPGVVEKCDNIDQDCDGLVDEEASDTEAWYADADEDGYGDPGTTAQSCTQPDGYIPDATDCDDGDEDVHPGATELCNEVDDDCDDEVDEGVDDGMVWHSDGDDDGYGDPDRTTTSCDQPDGYVEDATDCDDGDPAVNPGATEICNGLDDDCDANFDEADDDLAEGETSTWYNDLDEDGYGSDGDFIEACLAPGDSYIEIGGDCNDSNALAFPGADEVCATGELEDCTLSEDEARALCLLSGSGADLADAARYGGGADVFIGASVAAAGDVDGDGLADVLVGAPDSAGGVYLLGGALDRSGTVLSSAASYTARRTGGASEELGRGLSGGDLDEDGYDDLLMGAPYNDPSSLSNAGIAYAAFGPITGSKAASLSDVAAAGGVTNQYVGGAVAAGDADGDGATDFLIGAAGYKDGSDTNSGALFVLYGPLSAESLSLGSTYDLRLVGADNNDKLGTSLVAAGDVDGDGVDDVLAGSPECDDAGTKAGKAMLLFGPLSSGTADDLAGLSYRGAANDDAGTALAAPGDVDGDGYNDILVGSPGYSSDKGRAALLLGAAFPALSVDSDDADALLVGSANGDALGTSLAGALDLEGDGLGDLALGAPGYDSGLTGIGAVWLVSGLTSGTVALGGEGVLISGGAKDDAFGSAVAGVGDTDGDGWEDLAVGAPGYDSSSLTDAGALFLFARWY